MHLPGHQDSGAAAHDGLARHPFALYLHRLGTHLQATGWMAKADTLPGTTTGSQVYQGAGNAVAMATAAVPIMAWCSLPMDRARTQRSMDSAVTSVPLADT